MCEINGNNSIKTGEDIALQSSFAKCEVVYHLKVVAEVYYKSS